jgi:hypothetical protein
MNNLEKKPRLLKILSQSLGWLGASASGLALILYCYLGTFSRFYADDFCMSGYVVRLGFWQAQWFQYTTWSNRFTGMFLLSLSDLLGTSFIKWWTSLAVIIWVIGLTWAMLKICRLLHMQMPKWMAVLISEWIILFSILLAPQVYQSLFWRIGLITYTVPLVLLSSLIGILIQGYLNLQESKKASGWIVLAGFIAFLGGGLSETYLVLQITILGLALLILLMVNNKEKLKFGLKPIGSGLIGSLLSMVIVLAAPGNAVRQAAISVHPAILEVFKMIITNAVLFFYISLKSNAFQMLLAALAPMIFVYFGGIRMSPPLRPSSIILVALLSPIILFITLAAVMAPAAYAQSSYPDGRVLMDASFIVVIFMVVEGFLFGLILNQLHDLAGEPVPVKLQLLSAVFVLIIILYPIYDAYKSFRSIPEYRAYATGWDARDARIKAATLMGLDQIVESSLDAPGQLADINTDPHNWVNNCVAQFYDLASISALP